MNIIDNLLLIMKNRNIKASDLDKDIGIKPSTFVSWKKGAQPPADKLMLIMDYLKISPNELFGYVDEEDSGTQEEIMRLYNLLPEQDKILFLEQLKLTVKIKGLDEEKNKVGRLSDSKIG